MRYRGSNTRKSAFWPKVNRTVNRHSGEFGNGCLFSPAGSALVEPRRQPAGFCFGQGHSHPGPQPAQGKPPSNAYLSAICRAFCTTDPGLQASCPFPPLHPHLSASVNHRPHTASAPCPDTHAQLQFSQIACNPKMRRLQVPLHINFPTAFQCLSSALRKKSDAGDQGLHAPEGHD